MSYTCEHCDHIFSRRYSLTYHQRTAKYCLKRRNQLMTLCVCKYCEKNFSTKYTLIQHMPTCIKKNIYDAAENYRKTIENKDKYIDKLEKRTQELLDLILQISTASIVNDKKKIQELTKKYVKKQPRDQYQERNVIYIITTPSLQKDRRYILGKATNLTSRLSTYNKTDEHEVIFYISCDDKEQMTALENLVFIKLNEHREQANRERFILPENKDINFFKDKIQECHEFITKQ